MFNVSTKSKETGPLSDLSQNIARDMRQVSEDRDREAFSRLYDHFAPMIRAFCYKSNPGARLLADEVVQDVMLKIWQKAGQFDDQKASINTWIYTLTRNCRIDYLRKNGKHVSDIDPEPIWDSLVDENENLLASVQLARQSSVLNEKLAKLSSDQRQILSKVYLEGKTQQETADELDIPLGTVKSRTRLALQRMSMLMGES